MFHTKNGLFFERLLKDGMVRIVKTTDGKTPNGENVALDEVIDKSTFASVFASMSVGGETAVSWARALELLSK